MSNQILPADGKEGDFLRELLTNADEGDVKKINEVSMNFMLKFGVTALLYAAMNGFTEIAKQQLACPCNRVNFQDKDGWTALTWACSAGHVGIARMLLNHPDLDVNVQDKRYSDTALMWACYKGHTRIVKLLLTHYNIKINLQRNCGTTALTLAAGEGHTEIVQMLLACHGVDVNLRPQEGDSAIMAAAGRGHTEIVRLLLASPGIDINAQDYAGKTALDLAANEKCKDLLRLHRLSATVFQQLGMSIPSIPAIPDAPHITVRPPTPRTLSVPRTQSIQSKVVATIANYITTSTTSTATSPIPQQQPSPSRPSSWLAARLLASGYDLAIVRDCEQRLVNQEGFALENDFADCLPTEFNRAYLVSIGITGLGTQKHLLALHSELHAPRRAQQLTHLPAPPSFSSSLPVAQTITTAVAQVTSTTTTAVEDDNSLDPVYVELPVPVPVPVPVHADDSALDPVYVEPKTKRSKPSDNEGVHECQQS